MPQRPSAIASSSRSQPSSSYLEPSLSLKSASSRYSALHPSLNNARHPTGSQSCHTPSNHLCCSVLLDQRAKTSIRLLPQDIAVGLEVSWPSNDSQSCQPEISNHLYIIVLSVPLTNTSTRPSPHEATVRSYMKIPPNDHQSCPPPSNHLCHQSFSAPRTHAST